MCIAAVFQCNRLNPISPVFHQCLSLKSAFLSTGLSSTLLQQYNTYEYWNLNPAGTATGTASVYYDGYNDFGVGPNFDSTLKVAHKVPAGWANEGGIVSGTQSSGEVTSTGEISEWNIFTLGSTIPLSPLPTEVLDFTLDQNGCMQYCTGIPVSKVDSGLSTSNTVPTA